MVGEKYSGPGCSAVTRVHRSESPPPVRSWHFVRCDQMGIPDGMVRLSVGLEGAGDLIADLRQALGN